MAFGNDTPARKLAVDLGSGFQSTKKYTVWGWFQPASNFPMITNVLTLQNAPAGIAALACPYSSAQLAADPALLALPEVAGNASCLGTQTGEPLLYINYDP